MSKNNLKIEISIVLLLFVFCFLFSNIAFASDTGTIDSAYRFAWSENAGWINFGATHGNVRITDSAITGYAWSDNYGWINLAPTASGVKNNGEGTLSGYAWGENLGWINFNNVLINTAGKFTGFAHGAISGIINFNCLHCDVRTDWRPRSVRIVPIVPIAPIAPIPPNVVNFSGRAYPETIITLLKDAQIAATTVAGPDAKFQISLIGITAGNYIFAIYSEDRQDRRSTLLTFPIRVTQGVTINVTGIFISPTIAVDKSEVRWGDNIAIFGQSVPDGEITIVVSSEPKVVVRTKADKAGVYLYNFDTTRLEMGPHSTKSKAALDGAVSPFSKIVNFIVGVKTVPKERPKDLKSDLNADGRVNLVDFSIASYWYRRPLSLEMVAIERERLNGDGKINLVDFSIMAFYWTG